MEPRHTYKWSTVNDLVAFAAEEVESQALESATKALDLAAVLAYIIESQSSAEAQSRITAIRELRRRVGIEQTVDTGARSKHYEAKMEHLEWKDHLERDRLISGLARAVNGLPRK